MKIQVLFFGATAEVVGRRKIEKDFAGATRAGEAFKEIIAEYPQLENHTLLFAVNQEYASGDEPINDGDELAVFTHVSGG